MVVWRWVCNLYGHWGPGYVSLGGVGQLEGMTTFVKQLLIIAEIRGQTKTSLIKKKKRRDSMSNALYLLLCCDHQKGAGLFTKSR